MILLKVVDVGGMYAVTSYFIPLYVILLKQNFDPLASTASIVQLVLISIDRCLFDILKLIETGRYANAF